MGKHFDTLIDLLKTEVRPDERSRYIPNVHPYLVEIVNRASLFEFRLASNQVFPRTGKDKEEYNRYLDDYFDISEKYGQFLITPFELTAIEDLDSVVILDNIGGNKYHYVESMNGDLQGINIRSIEIGELTIHKPNQEGRIPIEVSVLYSMALRNGVKGYNMNNQFEIDLISNGMCNSAISYIEELVYIMDPENFIISQESNASIKENQRANKGKKKGRKPRKTAIRPHYICLGEDETKDFFKGESSEPRPIHPVRGHWRKLQSEKYRFKQGQRVPVRQHYRGYGQIDGKKGMHYQVLVKESPVQLTPYTN